MPWRRPLRASSRPPWGQLWHPHTVGFRVCVCAWLCICIGEGKGDMLTSSSSTLSSSSMSPYSVLFYVVAFNFPFYFETSFWGIRWSAAGRQHLHCASPFTATTAVTTTTTTTTTTTALKYFPVSMNISCPLQFRLLAAQFFIWNRKDFFFRYPTVFLEEVPTELHSALNRTNEREWNNYEILLRYSSAASLSLCGRVPCSAKCCDASLSLILTRLVLQL